MTHTKQWDFLKGKFLAGQLSHAYVFAGQNGIGKKEFAKEFVKFLNESVAGSALAIEKEQFADLLMVRSSQSDSSLKNEKDMMEIDVGQVRKINQFLSFKSYYGEYKTVIIENAERMNVEAQNSFLKTLEEPKGKTLLILLSSKPDALLPTIFSRCQTISFFPSGQHQATKDEQALLQTLLGVMDKELAVKFNFAKKVNLEGEQFGAILEVLARYFRNMLLAKLGVVEEKNSPTAEHYSILKIKRIIRLIESLHQQVAVSNASPKLALEVLLLEL